MVRNSVLITALLLAAPACRTGLQTSRTDSKLGYSPERIVVSPDEHGFVQELSGRGFHPWGLNYGHDGRLMEDFWENDWQTFAGDFKEMKALGANVVRLHLQFDKFMFAPDKPNPLALTLLRKTVRLAEHRGLYLDLTGLACYRSSEVPPWYDRLDERHRWEAQANFWEAVAKVCSGSTAIFCYDLMNEPISPGSKREAGQWSSGLPFGGYDFIQFISLDPAGRNRQDIALDWIRKMKSAIRKHDPRTLITVGLLPWSPEWKDLSGFVPSKIAPELDFISVHLYPDSKKPGEALEALGHCLVGKPIVIEETFPLTCSAAELDRFLSDSAGTACGWLGHYDGKSLRELELRRRNGHLTAAEEFYRQWLDLFVRRQPEFGQS